MGHKGEWLLYQRGFSLRLWASYPSRATIFPIQLILLTFLMEFFKEIPPELDQMLSQPQPQQPMPNPAMDALMAQTQAQIEVDRAKALNDIEIAKAKAQAQIQLEREKAAAN